MHKKGCNRYIKMQDIREGRRNVWDAKSARSILPWVGKKIFKAVAPVLLDEGRQLLTRKKNVKQAVKSVAKCSKNNVINTGKEALTQEIARYQKGGGLINTKARQTGRLKRR